MTQSTTRETLSERYKAIRQRLGYPRIPPRPIIPRDRIMPMQADEPPPEPVQLDQSDRASVVRRPEPEPVTIPPPKPNARRYVHILHDVATRHDVTTDDITGPCRSPRYVRARQEAFYLLREAGYSMLQIGRFCNRDHSTVMHGANKHEAMLKGERYDRQRKTV